MTKSAHHTFITHIVIAYMHIAHVLTAGINTTFIIAASFASMSLATSAATITNGILRHENDAAMDNHHRETTSATTPHAELRQKRKQRVIRSTEICEDGVRLVPLSYAGPRGPCTVAYYYTVPVDGAVLHWVGHCRYIYWWLIARCYPRIYLHPNMFLLRPFALQSAHDVLSCNRSSRSLSTVPNGEYSCVKLRAGGDTT